MGAGSSNSSDAPAELDWREIGRDLERRRQGGQLGAPVGALRLQDMVGEPLALPDREVRVLQRYFGERRRAPRHVRLIQDLELPGDQAQRPAVGHDVVDRDDELVLVRGQPEEEGTEERAPGQVERLLDLGLHVSLDGGLPVTGRHVLQVDRPGCYRPRRHDVLMRLTVAGHERRSQRLVAPHELGEGARQGGFVDRAAQPLAHRDRVRRRLGIELVEEPEPLLDERERHVAGPGHPGGP
jgi:hypothetical protein